MLFNSKGETNAMIKVELLANYRFDTLFEAFSQAFVDYNIQLNKAELEKMLARRGFVAELSFGAFDNDRLVSFTFNGIGNFNGVKTAYDTGTGTLKDYRGQGLASRVFSESIPFLMNAGVKQYLLEVLQDNTSAVSVYTKQGFKVIREFNYFVQDALSVNLYSKIVSSNYSIREIPYSDIDGVDKWWDFSPSWQNSFESISRKVSDFIVFGAFNNNNLVGYGILEPMSGDITQIAVDKSHRRNGVATAILGKMLTRNKHSGIKLINSDITCESVTKFLEKNGIPIQGKQFEMIKELVC